MEIANLDLRVRPTAREDKWALAALIRDAPFSHVHVDWHLPSSWLGKPGSVVVERDEAGLAGCFAIGADPPPAAWVRLAALATPTNAWPILQMMVEAALTGLGDEGINQLGWLAQSDWPDKWLSALGFEKIEEVETLVRVGTTLSEPKKGNEIVSVRPVQMKDLPHLAAIEKSAFEALWRHSVDGLRRGWQQSLSFEVAEMEGRLVGFQYSMRGEDRRSAHLVRMTVRPDVQRTGVGTMLLRAAFRTYRAMGIERVSLNTQVSNMASKGLYKRFGFRQTGSRLPVWSRPIAE